MCRGGVCRYLDESWTNVVDAWRRAPTVEPCVGRRPATVAAPGPSRNVLIHLYLRWNSGSLQFWTSLNVCARVQNPQAQCKPSPRYPGFSRSYPRHFAAGPGQVVVSRFCPSMEPTKRQRPDAGVFIAVAFAMSSHRLQFLRRHARPVADDEIS